MFEKFRTHFKNKPPLSPEYQETVKELERIIGISIDDPLLFIRSLSHRSSVVDNKEHSIGSYERLEFLGDAVLELLVSEFLFDRFPEENEGSLTEMRAKLVRGEALASYARTMGLNDLIIIGKRATGQGIKESVSTLSDVFESLLGAIYVTKGYRAAKAFAIGAINKNVDLEEISTSSKNYKSILLEYAQARGMSIPRYEVIKESGPDHDKTFQVKTIVNNQESGQGTGKTKKAAEQQAAREALKKLKNPHPHSDSEGG